ncbi:MAG: amidohydrolase [Betaproteobacteria bacterium]|nr:amidohydrolase [Betaproteobacteria bacterium]
MDTLLRNAFIYTGDVGHTCFARGALLISQGRLRWVGDESQLPDAPLAQVFDLGGGVVMPGLVNTHTHGGLSLHRGCCDSGNLFQWAQSLAPFTSALTLEDNRWGCYQAVLEMVRGGVTTACDCTRYGAGLFASVAAEVGMRSLGGALANSPALRPVGRPNWPLALEETQLAMVEKSGDDRCRFYLGAHSPYSCTPELLVEVKEAANRLDLPFVIHAAESREEVEIVRSRHGRRPIEHLHHLGVLDARTILAHCVWLDEGEIALLAASGAGVSHNPISNAKLASGIAPVQALRARGVPVGLGTDSMLSNNALNLFQEMKFAVLLQRAHRLDGHALSARDALAMATREGAQVLGWQSEIGSLEPGKAADLVILNLDHPLGLTPERVLSDLVFAAGPQHIRTVMVHGETIFDQGRFTRIDEREIRDRIRRHGEALSKNLP